MPFFSEHWHIALLYQVYLLIPQDVKVVFLGDGEFDNSHLLSLLKSSGWLFAVRIAKNRILCENGEPFKPKQIGVARHGYFEVPRVMLKNQPTLGTVPLLVYWDKNIKSLSISSPTLSQLGKRIIGTKSGSASKSYSPMRKAEAFISTKVVLPIRND